MHTSPVPLWLNEWHVVADARQSAAHASAVGTLVTRSSRTPEPNFLSGCASPKCAKLDCAQIEGSAVVVVGAATVKNL